MTDSDEPTGLSHGLLTLKKRSFVQRSLLLLPRWITPNGVTVFRAVLIWPFLELYAAQAYWPAILLLTFALILDFVDGALAAVRNLRTETGAFLDPLADKIVICAVLFTLAPDRTPFFTWLAWAISVIAMLLTAARVLKLWLVRSGRLPKETSVAANSAGKLKMTAETVGILALLIARGQLFGAALSPYFAVAALLTLALSLRYAVPSLIGQARGILPAFFRS
jgi:phosphatidylglycerophosphate synthase